MTTSSIVSRASVASSEAPRTVLRADAKGTGELVEFCCSTPERRFFRVDAETLEDCKRIIETMMLPHVKRGRHGEWRVYSKQPYPIYWYGLVDKDNRLYDFATVALSSDMNAYSVR